MTKIPINRTTTINDDKFIQKLQLDYNFTIREFEYIDKTSLNETPYKTEIITVLK